MLKKALLVGINAYKDYPLEGCVNDVLQMKEVLESIFGFRVEDIHCILDKDATRNGIISGLQWLAESEEIASIRVFYYVGQGHFVPDVKGASPTGSVSTLVPCDYKKTGHFTEYDLEEMFDQFPTNSHLTVIIDASHAAGSTHRYTLNSFNENKAAESVISVDKSSKKILDDEFEKKLSEVMAKFEKTETTYQIGHRHFPTVYEEQANIEQARRKYLEDQRKFILEGTELLRGITITAEEFQRRYLYLTDLFERQRFTVSQLRQNDVFLYACRHDQTAAEKEFARKYHGAFSYLLIKILRESAGRITYEDLIKKIGKALHDYAFNQIPQLVCRIGIEKAQVFSVF